jgi:hypothetical protein
MPSLPGVSCNSTDVITSVPPVLDMAAHTPWLPSTQEPPSTADRGTYQRQLCGIRTRRLWPWTCAYMTHQHDASVCPAELLHQNCCGLSPASAPSLMVHRLAWSRRQYEDVIMLSRSFW